MLALYGSQVRLALHPAVGAQRLHQAEADVRAPAGERRHRGRLARRALLARAPALPRHPPAAGQAPAGRDEEVSTSKKHSNLVSQ